MGWTGGKVGWASGSVGGICTDVEAGIEVLAEGGIAVRGVAVSMKKRRGVGEGVLLGVTVGVGVSVRVFVMVGVGPVAVGKGP